jgi:hypothetical protein
MNEPQTLTCRIQNRPVIIDGRESEIEWYGADSVIIQTRGGANFEYSSTPVTIKTQRSAYNVYFLLRWTDPTRSLNSHLEKADSGWVEVKSEFVDRFGEDVFSQDQAALYFSRSETCLSTCHIGGAAGSAGRHYTGGDTADVWVWMAVSTNPVFEADDRHWTGWQADTGDGRRFDNKAAGGYRLNFDSVLQYPYFVPTHRAFRDAIVYGTGGYEVYDPRTDKYKVGDRIPATLVAPTTGDRGDVKARGTWRNGVWTVEFSRRRSTGSNADLAFTGETILGVAVFDNADRKHAFDFRPIRLVLE